MVKQRVQNVIKKRVFRTIKINLIVNLLLLVSAQLYGALESEDEAPELFPAAWTNSVEAVYCVYGPGSCDLRNASAYTARKLPSDKLQRFKRYLEAQPKEAINQVYPSRRKEYRNFNYCRLLGDRSVADCPVIAKGPRASKEDSDYDSEGNLRDFTPATGSTPITALQAALGIQCSQLVTQLLAMGADPRVVAEGPCLTPLMLALKAQNDDLVDLMIAQGVDITTPDYKGATPLMYALYYNSALVDTFLEKRARVDSVDQNGATPLIYWCASFEDSEYSSPARLEITRKLLCMYDNADHRTVRGFPALAYAIINNNRPLVELLVRHNKDLVKQVFGNGMTPLSSAMDRVSCSGSKDAVAWQAKIEKDFVFLTMLIEAGADVNVMYEGVPLLATYITGHAGSYTEKFIELFVKAGVDLNLRDESGNTVVALAAGVKKEDITLPYLVDHPFKPIDFVKTILQYAKKINPPLFLKSNHDTKEVF